MKIFREREVEKCLFNDALNCSDYLASRCERNTRVWVPSGITMRKKQRSIHGKNLSQCHVLYHKCSICWPKIGHGFGVERPAINCL